jgi:hypothetical protein
MHCKIILLTFAVLDAQEFNGMLIMHPVKFMLTVQFFNVLGTDS